MLVVNWQWISFSSSFASELRLQHCYCGSHHLVQRQHLAGTSTKIQTLKTIKFITSNSFVAVDLTNDQPAITEQAKLMQI